MQQNEAFITVEVPLACTLTATELVTRAEEVNDLFKHVQQVDELEKRLRPPFSRQ